jgi:hypothetical protein
MNDIEKAVDYFTKSLNEDPYFEDAIVNLVDLLDALDSSHLLASYFGDVTEFDPQVN